MRLIFYSIFLLSILLSSCKKEENASPYNWKSIELSGAEEIYAFHGNIDDELLIATANGVLKTTDKGKNWWVVLDRVRGVFRQQGDSLLVVNSGSEHWFSLDNGDHWTMFRKDGYLFVEDYQWVSTSTGIDYRIESPFNDPPEPDKVLKSTTPGTWEEVFSYKHIINVIYNDSTDRIYLGTNGDEWDENTGTIDTTRSNNAIIYILEP